MSMRECNQKFEHETVTEAVLCNAGNASLACEDRLLVMIQFPEIVDADEDAQRFAYNNLRHRFGYSEADIRKAQDEV